MKVLLDTDITSYLFGNRDERVRSRFLAYEVGDVGISSITAAELAFGVSLNPSGRNRQSVGRALESLAIVPFDLDAAHVYGELRAGLHRQGTLIGSLDMLIAAHALSLGVPLATNNLREFRRVPGLRIENWLA